MLKTFVRFIFCVGTLNNFGNITKAIKQISCAISIILLLVISGLILPTDAYSSSPKVQSGINKSNVKNVKTNPSIPQKPKQIKSLKSKGIIKPTAKPFLQIKKAYVFPNDKKLRVVIQNTGGSLSSRDYMTGKLEITLLGTSTKWWWPLIKLKQKNDHFISETTFNTNKKLTEPS
ncbi:MAG: hypothetical protein GY707_04810, partial [Desulfobacteraceae bacterium]|nr:hypothetical protein [Desulfobacteraceae bacterium]